MSNQNYHSTKALYQRRLPQQFKTHQGCSVCVCVCVRVCVCEEGGGAEGDSQN